MPTGNNVQNRLAAVRRAKGWARYLLYWEAAQVLLALPLYWHFWGQAQATQLSAAWAPIAPAMGRLVRACLAATLGA